MRKNKLFTDKSEDPNQIHPQLKLPQMPSIRSAQLHSQSTLLTVTGRHTDSTDSSIIIIAYKGKGLTVFH